jgi:hypothetical protein
MARTSPATQVVVDAGLAVTLTAPSVDGDIAEAGRSFAIVDNASGVSINVTLSNPNTVEGLDVADRVVAVAAGARKLIPIPSQFKQATDAVEGPGMALINYSAVASVTRAIVRLRS